MVKGLFVLLPSNLLVKMPCVVSLKGLVDIGFSFFSCEIKQCGQLPS